MCGKLNVHPIAFVGSGFYPTLHNRGECKQEPGGVTHGYTRDLLTYLLTYLLHYLVECCCAYLVHPKFELYILSNKRRQDSFLAVSVK